jgi:ketosteroid isomerase-like protein
MAVLSGDDGASEMAIRDLTARFSDAVNRRAADEIGALFAQDGRWDVHGMPLAVGPEAVSKQFEGLIGHFEFLVQLTHSGVVDVDGSVATARWYITEHCRDTEGSGSFFLGTYDDRHVLTEDGWRFAYRRFRFLYRGRDDLTGKSYAYEALGDEAG